MCSTSWSASLRIRSRKLRCAHRTHTHTHTHASTRTRTHTQHKRLLRQRSSATALQLIAELVQAAGRPACKLALRAMQPQIDYVLHGDPLAEPHDYDDPCLAFEGANDPKYCMTADDLRKMDDGRAAEWAAAQSPAQVAPTCTCAWCMCIHMCMHLCPSRRALALTPLALSHTLSLHPGSFRSLHRSAAHKRYTGTSTNAMRGRHDVFRRGMARGTVALSRRETPSGARWTVCGLRPVPVGSTGRRGDTVSVTH